MGLTEGLVDNNHLFDGFASNAVISIIAVMIIGAGLDKTGIMSKVAAFIMRIGGKTEARIIPIISAPSASSRRSCRTSARPRCSCRWSAASPRAPGCRCRAC
jgi:hypothetical protein